MIVLFQLIIQSFHIVAYMTFPTNPKIIKNNFIFHLQSLEGIKIIRLG